MNEYLLLDLLPSLPNNDFDFTAAYKDQNYCIFSTQYFYACVRQHFPEHKIGLFSDDKDTATEEVKGLFLLWKAYRSDTYARRAYALSEEYEIFDDMDVTETKSGNATTTHDTTDTRTVNLSDNRTLNLSDKTDYGKTSTVTDGVYGVNSAAAVNADTSTSTDGGTDTTAHTGSDNLSHSGTDALKKTGTDKTEDGYTLRRYGNDGKTDHARILNENYGLLKLDLSFTAVCDFIDRYAYYTGGLDL